jgi:Flp pilus assembly protein TadG
LKWQSEAGQAVVEFAVIVPLVGLLLLVIVACGYGSAAQLVVIAGAGQGGRVGAMRCAEQAEPAEVLQAAQERALAQMAPLSGTKTAGAAFEGEDLVVTATYTYLPPLPGAQALFGDSLTLGHRVRYYCGLQTNPAG